MQAYTIAVLQSQLGNCQIRVTELDSGNSNLIQSHELSGFFAPDTTATPNGHNDSYTIYQNDQRPIVLTPVCAPTLNDLPWSRSEPN